MANLTNANRPEASQPNEGGVDFEAASMGGRSRFGAAGMVAAAALGLGGATPSSQGGLIYTMANDPTHLAMGNSFLVGGSSAQLYGGAAVSLRVNSNLGERNTSAIMLSNQYVLTAYHNVADLMQQNPTFEISTGANFLNDRGSVYQIAEVITLPGAAPSNPNAPDMVILRVNGFVPGVNVVQMGSFTTDSVLTMTGNGFTAEVGGTAFRDGFMRAGNQTAREYGFLTGGYSPDFYREALFDISSGLPFGMRARSGDSGGGQWSNGLVGLTVYGSSGVSGFGVTGFVDLTTPSMRSIIDPYRVNVPSPGVFSSFAVGAGILGLTSRRRR